MTLSPIGGGVGEGVGNEAELCTRCQEPRFWLGQLTERKNDPSLMASCGYSMGFSPLSLSSLPSMLFTLPCLPRPPWLLLPICDDLERAEAFLPVLLLSLLKCYRVPH